MRPTLALNGLNTTEVTGHILVRVLKKHLRFQTFLHCIWKKVIYKFCIGRENREALILNFIIRWQNLDSTIKKF